MDNLLLIGTLDWVQYYLKKILILKKNMKI